MRIEELGHLSQSSLNMFLRCPAQFMFRYILGIKIQPSASMVLGSTVDSSLDFNYKFKIENKEDRKMDEVLDFFGDAWEKSKGEIEVKEGEQLGEFKDNGVKVVGLYQTEVSPNLMPVVSQKEVQLNLEGVAVPIVGYIDVIDDQTNVIDNKVRAKSPVRDKDTGLYLPTEGEKLQISIYENGLLSEGIVPKSLRIDTMVTTKTPKIVSAEVPTTVAELVYIEKLVKLVIKSVEHEIFVPNRQSMMCSRRNCGFCELCEREFGGNVKK